MAQLNTDLSGLMPLKECPALAPGEYHVRIVRAEVKSTRTGGSRVAFVYEVAEGRFQGCRIFDNLNVWNPNPKTVEIARRQLKSIAVACGCPDPDYISSTSEFAGREMRVRLTLRKDEKGNTYHQVRAYYPVAREAEGTPGKENILLSLWGDAASAVRFQKRSRSGSSAPARVEK